MAGIQIGIKRFTFKERRELGLTRHNLLQILREMRLAGEAQTDDKDARELAMDVAFVLIERNRSAYCNAAAPGREWESFFEALLAFLEKFLPLILASL